MICAAFSPKSKNFNRLLPQSIMIKLGFRILGVLASLSLCGLAHATITDFEAILSGPNESPSNSSPGTGFADVVYDSVAHTLSVNVTFSGLTANDTASHIHAATASPGTGTAGVATTTPTFSGFPTGVTSGTYSNVLDLTLASSFNPAYVTAQGSVANAEAALIQAMFDGKAYLNIHSTAFPSGEIRGFLAVPDGAVTAALVLLGVVAMLGFARYQRASVS